MSKTKTVQDLWREFKVRNYGKNIGCISVVQLRESELVFHSGVAAILIEMIDNISELPDGQAVQVLNDLLTEIQNFYNKAQEEYDRTHKR